jgi:Rieske 2Fe-2S family protein
MAFKPRAVLPDTARTLPARYYTDPLIFGRERELFYREMWIGAGRLDDIPEPGRWITRELDNDRIFIIRAGPGAEVRAFHNVCRHRGTTLCDGESGACAGAIRCPYHAWTYDFEGRLIGAPHMDGSPGFDRSDLPLAPVGCAVWDGFIFVNLSGTAGPVLDQLADLPDKFRAWQMGDLRRAHQVVYDVGANWKLLVQNYNECLHCPTLHPALNKLSHYLSGENEARCPHYIGGRMDLNPGAETMSMTGRTPRRPLPGLSEIQRRQVYYYSVFPNFMLAPHPDYVLTHSLWPLAPDRTRITCDWLVHPDELARDDFDLSEETTFWDMTNRQDWRVCELAQAGISSRGYQPGPYSNREDLLYAFDRYIVERLGDR